VVFLRRLLKNRRWLIFILIIVIVGVIINITSKKPEIFSQLKHPIIAVFSPVQKIFSSTSYAVSDGIKTIPQLFTLRNENEKLKKKIAELEKYKRYYLEYQQENANLRKMLNLKQLIMEHELEAAEVIGREPGNWFNVILIDKGKRDGINKDMAVMVDEGLVGYIVEAESIYSKVLLITDERSSVSAIIQRSRDNGIVKGSIETVPQGCLKMVFLPYDSNITKGDVVISSGMGGILPKGIVIGEIIEAQKESHELTQYAIIKPAVDFQKLEMVFVVKNRGGLVP
jgi:rod shape-determining protein MreC